MHVLAAIIVLAAFQANFYDQGLKALDGKQYQAAADAFTKALADNPKDFTAHFNLAFAYSMLNRDADAIAEYQKTLALKPNLYQADLNLGILLLRQKRAGDALPHLLAASQQKPKDFRAKFYLAEALRQNGSFTEAEQQYNDALQIDPKSAGAELGLGEALAKEQRLTDAIPHFKKAAELDPHYHDALLELAALLEQAKQNDDAIQLYEQFPDNAAAQERTGALLFAAGRYADSIPHFEASVKMSPTVANQVGLAQAYIKNKEPDKAFPIVQRVVATDPRDYDLRMLYGRMVRDKRQFPEAAQQFMAAAKLQPDKPEVWSELAGVLLLMNDYEGSMAALDKIAALHAEKPGHVFLRALIFDKVHQLKPALAAYQRFLAMDGGKDSNQDFQARQRIRIIENELNRR